MPASQAAHGCYRGAPRQVRLQSPEAQHQAQELIVTEWLLPKVHVGPSPMLPRQ